jgi:hypothetical protein
VKYIYPLAALLLFSTVSFAQTNDAKTPSSKFKTENNYKSFLGKPKYKLKSKQSVSLNGDDFFNYKTLGLGFQRKFGSLMVDVQGSKGIRDMGETAREIFPKMFGGIFGGGLPDPDTARQNYGAQAGVYKMSKYASMTGFLYGLTATYDNYSIKYSYYDRTTSDDIRTSNNINKLGVFLTVGARAIIAKNVGVCIMGGVGYQNATSGNKNIADDEYSNLKKGSSARFGNVRLYYSL